MAAAVQLTGVTSADAQDDLTDVDTGDRAVGLAPSTTHTSLQTIGTSARQHLVDTDDVVRVSADAEVETLLTGVLDEVLVGADAGGLEGLGAQLLILVGDKVDAEGEVVDVGTLATQVEDADLGVGDTTVEPRLGVRLESILLAFTDSHRFARAQPEAPSSHGFEFMTFVLSSRGTADFLRTNSPPRARRPNPPLPAIIPCSCSSGSNEQDGGPF